MKNTSNLIKILLNKGTKAVFKNGIGDIVVTDAKATTMRSLMSTGWKLINKGGKIDTLKTFILASYSSKNKISPNNYWDKCALDVFAHNVSYLDMIGDECFIGLSCGTPFIFSPDGGFWGSKNVVGDYTITLNGPGPSSISLETICRVLYELYITKNALATYKGIVGNCLGNEARQFKRLSCLRTELCTSHENFKEHGPVWNRAMDEAGIRLYFSAKNKDFIKYIKSCPVGHLTIEYIRGYVKAYPMTYILEEEWDGDIYLRIL